MAIQYEHSQKGSDKNIANVNLPEPEARKGKQWFHTCSPQYLLLMVMLVAAVLISITTLVVFLTRYHPASATNPIGEANATIATFDDNEQNETQTSASLNLGDSNATLSIPEKLTIVSRKEWLALPPVEEPTPLQLPVPYVIVLHTATENCSDQASCTFHVRFIQSFHIDSRGWDDIGYNFLVGGDGFVYEGRGWKNVGAHSYGYNAKSVGIGFIGTFNKIMPPERQIDAAKQLIEQGLEKGYIAKDYKLLASRQIQTTQSPGLLLYEDIKKWPHWAEEP